MPRWAGLVHPGKQKHSARGQGMIACKRNERKPGRCQVNRNRCRGVGQRRQRNGLQPSNNSGPHLAWLRHTRRQECRNAVCCAAAHHAASWQAAALCCLLGDGGHRGARGHHRPRKQVRKRLHGEGTENVGAGCGEAPQPSRAAVALLTVTRGLTPGQPPAALLPLLPPAPPCSLPHLACQPVGVALCPGVVPQLERVVVVADSPLAMQQPRHPVCMQVGLAQQAGLQDEAYMQPAAGEQASSAHQQTELSARTTAMQPQLAF